MIERRLSFAPVQIEWASSASDVAEAHLPMTLSVDRVVEVTGTNIGPVALRQIRELIADLIGL